MNQKDKSIYRDYAWKYFALHADQRLKTFNFFLLISSVIIGGFFTLLKNGINFFWLPILPFSLSFLSFVFWQLDLRNKQLINTGEEALKFLDKDIESLGDGLTPSALRLFDYDDYIRKEKIFPWSFSTSFRIVFVIFGLVGFFIGGFFLIQIY